MWYMTKNGEREFRGGREEWPEVARIAARCSLFDPDAEEEWVTDEERSCYNCRFRRWTAASFACMAPGTAP